MGGMIETNELWEIEIYDKGMGEILATILIMAYPQLISILEYIHL
jgi:hypothetical protein